MPTQVVLYRDGRRGPSVLLGLWDTMKMLITRRISDPEELLLARRDPNGALSMKSTRRAPPSRDLPGRVRKALLDFLGRAFIEINAYRSMLCPAVIFVSLPVPMRIRCRPSSTGSGGVVRTELRSAGRA